MSTLAEPSTNIFATLKKSKKTRLVDKLSASLARFDPKYQGHFVCPTCLRAISVADQKQITKAHIIPRSAGGRLVTLICSRCNSAFGSRQDKWFGEYLHLRSTNGTAFYTRHQKGQFEIAGERVGGRFGVAADGAIEFFIWRDATDPKAIDALMTKVAQGKVDSVSIPVPLMENRHLLAVGALTSAYLLWFRELGYSWALQKQLDPVRKFILDPASPFPRKSVARTPARYFGEPWIGVGRLNGELAVVGCVGDHLVFFPPADRHDYYASLPDDYKSLSITDTQGLSFYRDHDFGGPVGVIYHNRLIIAPDAIRERQLKAPFLVFRRTAARQRSSIR